MASYTIELRKICELTGRDIVESWFKNYNLEDYLTQEQIQSINEANIWNKDKLAKKIVDHYFMREIGFETPFLFEHMAKTRMQEIMEDYLPVIYSNSIKFDPLVNVDFTETLERDLEGTSKNKGTSNSSSENTGSSNSTSENTGSSNSSSSSNGSGLTINSDTPQTNISKTNLLNGNYASSASANETENSIKDETNTSNNGTIDSTSSNTTTIDTTSSNDGTSTSKETYTKNIKGNSGVSATAQALIKQYRDIIRAVDREIIDDLNCLFMGIY